MGHSTLDSDVFIQALKDNGIEMLVDVRSHPGSRRYPQFGKQTLASSLVANGIQTQWYEALGGWRKCNKETINGAWRNASFRGYADYMQTAEFDAALTWLMSLPMRTAIMCAESVPWRCHRSMIADALVARGVQVQNILIQPSGRTSLSDHALRDFAKTDGTRVWYPATEQRMVA